jgi:type IV pilus assembly protein PilN
MTPIRINLLPHRQMRRARAQRMFTGLAVLFAGLGVAVVAVGQYWISSAQERQEHRNAFLREEIAKLDKQIAEISQLKEKTQNLLARKDVVESLQANRGESVRLFAELSNRVPEGLYLKNLKQTGDAFSISGYAQSSARVSTFMRALNESTLFQEPKLVEVKSAQVGNQRLNEFMLNVQLERAAQSKEDAVKPRVGG